MYKFLIENFLVIVIGILVISQIIIPCFTRRKYFWLFRKKDPAPDKESLHTKVDHTVEAVREVKQEVDENLEDAQDLSNKLNNEDN